jgi:hypothetical protein
MTEKPFAFVLMPFDDTFGDTYFLGIKDTADKLGIMAERVDEQVFHREGILQRIYNQIEAADFVIADMTGRNPNVFYEVGYAHAKGKTCILLTENADDIPFDLKHQRHIVYSSIQDLTRKLSLDLKVVKEELQAKAPPVTVELSRTWALLQKTKYSAAAEVTLTFDMHNRTSENSPDIYGIYFYTGVGWTFTQDNQECSQSTGETRDLGFAHCHFVKTPVPRLVKGAWAQVKLIGTKRVASSLHGEELKDSYELAGRALFRISTATGNYDNLINIKVLAEEIPF